jgi:DNA-cytosine methyltransferase
MTMPRESSKKKQFIPHVTDYLRGVPENIQLVDLFAGIGGFHYGIGAAARQLGIGVQTQLVSEINKSCQMVYEHNHGNTKSIQGDINEINLKKFAQGEADFLTAGFPCQPFSNSGRKMGLSDPRGQFYERIQEIILAFRAKTFILENVPGMTKNGGKSFPSQLAFLENQKIGTTMQTLEKAMIHGLQSSSRSKSRYNIKWIEVNSAHLGSPQVRKRVYIIGVRADLGEIPDFSLLNVKSRGTVFNEIAEDNPSGELALSKNQEKNIRSFMKRGSAPSYTEGMRRVGQAYLCEGGNVGQAYHAYGLVPTLTKVWARFLPIYFPTDNETLPAVGEVDFTPGREYGKGQIRRASVREVMRLQGFPDSFVPHERDSEAYQHAGNAVNSLVVQAIAAQLLTVIR